MFKTLLTLFLFFAIVIVGARYYIEQRALYCGQHWFATECQWLR